jgi:purine-binding chemotaxis protein CheW
MSDSLQSHEEQQEDLYNQLTKSNAAGSDEEHDKFLVFSLAGMNYGVDILGIKEIIEYGQMTKIPMAPEYIRGVINLRGNVVPVVDLSVRLGKQPQEAGKKTCIIILETEQSGDAMSLGFVVDAVNEVIDIEEENIETTPSFGMDIRTDFVAGMGRVGDEFVVILDLDKVLSIKELSEFFDNLSEEQD